MEFPGEFDINEEGGTVIYNTESIDGVIKIHSAAYLTAKEKLEEERLQKAFLKKKRDAGYAMSKCKDPYLKIMWKMLRKEKEFTKYSAELAEKMNMTVSEVKALKRRLARFLRQKVKADVHTYEKEEYEEKPARTNFRH